MILTKKEQLFKLFEQKKGIIKLSDLFKNNISKYYLLKLIENGEVEILKNGIFLLKDFPTNEFLVLKNLIPKGVFCLFSAWQHHKLTTYLPHTYHIAIQRKSKIKLPDYPPIKLYYWDKKALQTGVEIVKIDECEVLMSDIEKSVCDALKFRNKIGKDILNEILKEYLQSKNKKLDTLIKYAKVLRVEKILMDYLNILL